jgi:hypothetical protein
MYFGAWLAFIQNLMGLPKEVIVTEVSSEAVPFTDVSSEAVPITDVSTRV